MKHFIIISIRGGDKLCLPIEDITYMDTYDEPGFTTVHTNDRRFYSNDEIEDIAKKIYIAKNEEKEYGDKLNEQKGDGNKEGSIVFQCPYEYISTDTIYR